MKAIATFHQPTSVTASLKINLTEDEDTEYLVVAKTSGLEVFAILPDALCFRCSIEIWGRISALQPVPTNETAKHHLLVLTDHPDPRVLLIKYVKGNADDAEVGSSLKTLKTVSLSERNARPSEHLNTCIVDDRGNVAVAYSQSGKLRILELVDGLITNEFDTSVRELNIISLSFLRTSNARAIVLAILYRDPHKKLVVTSHELSGSPLELSPSPSTFLPEFSVADADSTLLIPVPPQTASNSNWNTNGGVLVLGGSTISFYPIERKQKKKKNGPATPKASGVRVAEVEAKWSFCDITAWSQVDEEGTRFLLGDSFGRLALLTLDLKRPFIDILHLGEISPPMSLTPLSSRFIYVGSHYGDSQLIRLVPDKSSANDSYVDVSETYKNIAPIQDAIVEDIDNSGQSTIVTCSGGFNSGSLRVIRNGANFTEDARVDGVPNISGLWPLKNYYEDEYHQFVLVTTGVSTYLLKLLQLHQETSVVCSNDFIDLKLDVPTLAAANVLSRVNTDTGKSEYQNGSYMVQVTPDVVIILNTQTGTIEDQWFPDHGRKIVLADISPSQICVALSGGVVILLNYSGDKLAEKSRKTFIEPNGKLSEISSVTIAPIRANAKYSSYVILGFWSSLEIRVLALPAFESMDPAPIIMPHLPRSLLLHDFGDHESGSHPHLMVGLANGAVISYPFTKGRLGEMKLVTLGEGPLSLRSCFVNNKSAVLASGTRSALFYWSKDSLSYSSVLVKDITSASPIHTTTFSSSMIFSTTEGLVIGRILELDKLHIRTVFLGTENPFKLAYLPSAKLLGVGCLQQDPTKSLSGEWVGSSFKLLDAIDYRTTHDFPLEVNEELTAVRTVSLECENGDRAFFAVGTTYYNPAEREPSRGRILLFSTGISQNQSPHLFAAAEVGGGVNALECIKGKLVAAINTGVDVFSPVWGDDNKLVRLASWNHNYLVVTMVVIHDQIVIGDAVSSLAVLKLEGHTLVAIARDYGPLWPICLGMFDRRTLIGANNDHNLFSYKLQQQGDKMLLEQDGLYNMGEVVNKFVPGGFDSSENRTGFETKHLLFTSTGRISVAVDVNDKHSRTLSEIERNLAGFIKGAGEVNHTLWRAPANIRGRSDSQATAIGFLDGDLIERFLDYHPSSPEISRILAGKNEAEKIQTTYTKLRSVVEALRNTH